MSITREQVEAVRIGARMDIDYEFVDFGDGQIIRKLRDDFDVPTQSELDAVKIQAQQKADRKLEAYTNIKEEKNKGKGSTLKDLEDRIDDLEDLVQTLLLQGNR